MKSKILKILILVFTIGITTSSVQYFDKSGLFISRAYADELEEETDESEEAEEVDYLLKDIYIAGNYSVNFSPDVFTYSLDVSAYDEDILLKLEPKYKSDKVYLNGVEVLRDDKYRIFANLEYGKNVLNIDVKDSYDGTTYRYILYVYRGGSDYIALDDINIDGRNIGFEPYKRSYNIELDEDDEIIRLNCIPKEGNYSVKVNDTLLGEKNTIKLKFSVMYYRYVINVTLIDNDTKKESKYVLNFYLGIPISPDVEGAINDKLKPNQWILENGRWRYNDYKGEYLRDTWFYDHKYCKWFYFNSRGYMHTGWLEYDDGNTYYLDNHGAMQTGWIADNGKWYYLDENGAMRKGWIKDKNNWYFLNNLGEMRTGWVLDRGKWYFLNKDGSMKTGWIVYDNEYYCLNDDGVMQTGWVKYNDDWYYMDDKTGAMKTGEWVFNEGHWYYMNYSGTMRTGFLSKDGKAYYFNSDGTMNTETKIIDGYICRFNKDGSIIFD